MDDIVAQLRKVKNGWVAYDAFGDIVAVATNDEQLAELVGITLEQQKQGFVNAIKELTYDQSAMRLALSDVRNGRKIDAIKAIRYIFKIKDDDTELRISLKDAKDLVEMMAEFI